MNRVDFEETIYLPGDTIRSCNVIQKIYVASRKVFSKLFQ